MVQDPQWMALLEAKPKFKKLYEYARSIKASTPYFCANSRWLCGINRRSLKGYVELLAEDDSTAIKVASRVIYSVLPDCRKCYCKVIGIPPKNSKRIYLRRLFEKLTEFYYWCNAHPDEANEVYQTAEVVIQELIRLGVSRLEAEAVLYLSADINDEFLDQFKEII